MTGEGSRFRVPTLAGGLEQLNKDCLLDSVH